MKRTFLLFFVLLHGASTFSQEKNQLLDRSFWKGQPSITEIEERIKAGHSPTALTEHNFDATGYAILEQLPLETIKYLLDQGNSVDKLTHDARTYLFWAAYKGNLELMNYLVEKGASTKIIDQHGYSLFMFTAVTGQENQAIYDYIIALGADPMAERDRQGRNALLAYASGMKSLRMIDYFIELGLDIHSVDKKGNGVFNHAAKSGDQKLLEQLRSEYNVSIEVNTKTNENAILFASTRFSRSGEETSLAYYEYLEGLGLDPTIVSSEGKSALHNLAARSNSSELFDYFLRKGVDANLVNEDGDNALIIASSRRKQDIISLLLEKTENINLQNREGHSCFSSALKYNTLANAKFLASKGANTNVIDKKGYDLGYHLIDAFRDLTTFDEKMDFLVSLGYDPSVIQGDGATLLHAAINKENIALMNRLLEMGIDINVKDRSGQTVLHYAAMQAKDEEMLRFLVDAGADVTITTEFEESAYDLAGANEILAGNSTNIDFLRAEQE